MKTLIPMLWLTGSALGVLAADFKDASGGYLQLIRPHYDRLIRVGVDQFGPAKTGLWLASVDLRQGGLPANPDPAVKRTYRLIHAPRGSTLYWEQPAVIAAYAVSRLTGDPRYRAAADRYLKDFLDRCVSPSNGLFLWGNHLYYDVVTDQIVAFSGGPYEARPLPCAWDMFWAISPEQTERCIRAMGVQHVLDAATGLFDRHASVKATQPPTGPTTEAHPFLEAGGVLVESLCWLSAQTGHQDPWLKERALLVARFSYGQRHAATGLLRNQPGKKRWDYYATTTEVGLWANCLLRATAYTKENEFRVMAREAVAAYLRHGWDAQAGRYYGQLNCADGRPRKPDRTAGSGADTVYQPGAYAELWEPLFPTHNYPMSLAEAALTLYQQTGDELFLQSVRRWAGMIARSTPANDGQGAYADQYGRCIHFLLRAARALDDASLFQQARQLAAEAVRQLHVEETQMFRSHPGEDRCDAVDGIGLLFLALLDLETGHEPAMLGFGW